MLSYFDDNDSASQKTVKVEFKNVKSAGGVKLTYYCLDKARDCEPVREERFTAENFSAHIKMPLYSTYFLEITEL